MELFQNVDVFTIQQTTNKKQILLIEGLMNDMLNNLLRNFTLQFDPLGYSCSIICGGERIGKLSK